jgi:hypothetical protein
MLHHLGYGHWPTGVGQCSDDVPTTCRESLTAFGHSRCDVVHDQGVIRLSVVDRHVQIPIENR